MSNLIPQMQTFINLTCMGALIVLLIAVLPFVFMEIKKLALMWRDQ